MKLSSNESPHGPGARALAGLPGRRRGAVPLPEQHPGGTAARGGATCMAWNPRGWYSATARTRLSRCSPAPMSGPGDEVVLSEHCFLMAKIHALGAGCNGAGRPRTGLLHQRRRDPEARDARTRLVAIASPNNPCGRHLPRAQLERLHAALPEEVILLVDAAYSEYATAEDYDNGARWPRGAERLMTRTFSKLYGLAGLRVGWGYGSLEIIQALEHLRSPFNVNAAAQAAAAAAVSDREHAALVRAYNERERTRVSEAVRALGITVVPSSANFVLLVFGAGRTPPPRAGVPPARGASFRARWAARRRTHCASRSASRATTTRCCARCAPSSAAADGLGRRHRPGRRHAPLSGRSPTPLHRRAQQRLPQGACLPGVQPRRRRADRRLPAGRNGRGGGGRRGGAARLPRAALDGTHPERAQPDRCGASANSSSAMPRSTPSLRRSTAASSWGPRATATW